MIPNNRFDKVKEAESEFEQSISSASVLHSMWIHMKLIPKRTLVIASVLLLGMEFALMRLTQWSATSSEIEAMQMQHEALAANLTTVMQLREMQDVQLAQAKVELVSCMRHGASMQSNISAMKFENSELAANSTKLLARRELDSQELRERAHQVKELGMILGAVEEGNSVLRDHLSKVESRDKMEANELDARYDQFVLMKKELDALKNKTNVVLQKLSASKKNERDSSRQLSSLKRQHSLDTERLAAAAFELSKVQAQSRGLEESSRGLLHKIEVLEQEKMFAKEDMDQHYKDFTKLKTERNALMDENARLRKSMQQLNKEGARRDLTKKISGLEEQQLFAEEDMQQHYKDYVRLEHVKDNLANENEALTERLQRLSRHNGKEASEVLKTTQVRSETSAFSVPRVV